MSLQVWLPLNGNLNNYGLNNNCTITNSLVVDDNGKLGKCYKSTASSQYLSSGYGNGLSAKNLSVSIWVKPLAESNNKIVLGSTTGTNQRFYIGIQSGCYQLAYGNVAWTYNTNDALATTNKWAHIVLTSDNNNTGKMYFNGNLITTITADADFTLASDIYAGGRKTGTNYNGTFAINDYRIYNHCLSEKEIREISKAKLIHYNFSTDIVNPNLLPVSKYVKGIVNDSYSTTSYTISDYTIHLNTSGNYGGSYFDTSVIPYQHWVVYSYKFKKTSGTLKNIGGHTGTTIRIQRIYLDKVLLSSTDAYSNGIDLTDDNTIHEIAIVFTSYSTVNNTTNNAIYIQPNRGIADAVSIDAWDIKLEYGNINGCWLPNSADPDYSNYSFLDKKVFDCGITNSYDGNINGIIAYYKETSTTIRANGGISFIPDGNGYIKIDNAPSADAFQNCTFAFWIKTRQPDNTQCIWCSRKTGGSAIAIHYMGSAETFRFDDGGQTSFSGGALTSDSWKHIAITRDENYKKFYVNGVLTKTVASTSFTSDTLGTNQIATIGQSSVNGVVSNANKLDGNLSDFRLYATTLSDEEIKEIYRTTASIDNNGNMYSYCFDEDDNTAIKNANVSSLEFQEESQNKTFFKSDSIHSHNFYEI